MEVLITCYMYGERKTMFVKIINIFYEKLITVSFFSLVHDQTISRVMRKFWPMESYIVIKQSKHIFLVYSFIFCIQIQIQVLKLKNGNLPLRLSIAPLSNVL